MSFEVLTATIGAFGTFVPMNIVQTRHADPDDYRKVSDLRLGLLLAGAFSFIIAAHYASKENSSTPYLYWLAGAGIMVVGYEFSLRNRSDIDLRSDGEKRGN